MNILRAKIISLEVAKKENESKIIELDSNLLDARLELSRVESDNETLKTEMKAKDDINNVLTAKANEAEETKAGLERKLKTWGQMIRKQNAEIKDLKKSQPAETNDDVGKLKTIIKDKENKAYSCFA